MVNLLHRLPQFARYVLVGISLTVVGYAIIFFCMYVLGLGVFTSNAIGYGIGLVISYLMNRHYIFRSTARKIPEIAKFLIVFVLAYTANIVVLHWLVESGMHAVLAQIISGVFYVVTAFLANKLLVFKPIPDHG